MKKQFVTIIALVIALVALGFSLFGGLKGKKMAYFDYNQVYDECELKKSLEKDLVRVVSARKSELDSMQLELSLMSGKIQQGNSNQTELDDFETLKNRFLLTQNKYEQENMRLKEEYSNQIRLEINDKAKEFSELHGLSYLFSAQGNGSLMYASESDDLTDGFTEFLNK